MDPRAAIEHIMSGDRCTEHARAYNEWRAGQGFAAVVLLPDEYYLGWIAANQTGERTRLADVQRIYRGHRCWMARCERRGGQGFVCVPVASLELV